MNRLKLLFITTIAIASVILSTTAPKVLAAGNLALGQPAVASSQEGSDVAPQKAVDGNGSTRWSSLYFDPQWIYVDLGAIYSINHVVLKWETAYGKAYQIQVSTDATNWTIVFSTTSGNGATDDITFASANARYVRVYGTQRGTPWGYSLWEFEVYGATAPPVLTSVAVSPATATVAVGGMQTFTATGLDQYGAAFPTTVDWMVSGGGTIDPVSGLFTASTVGGPFTVTATSTADSTVSGTAHVTVVDNLPVPSGNLALGQPAAASSQEGAVVSPQKAVDGNGSTRWSSLYSDPQWIYVDLGAIYPINHVVLKWETAYGKAYQIQVSNNATNWTTVFSETNGNGATDDITFASANARYVRVYGTQRGTPWGYSLWEFEVYGATAPPVLTSVAVSPATAAVTVGNTQTFTATGLDQYGAAFPTTVDWMVSGGGTIDPVSGLFTASTVGGPFTVTATSTADSTVSSTAHVTVVDNLPVQPVNLALGQPAAASSQEGAVVSPQKAVDGNGSTRWSSLYSDPQWIYVDLGTICFINHVVLKWEAAYGKAYQIQVSNNATNWTTVFSETNGNGATDDINFSLVLARYVRVYGTQRGTEWGYSLWEFEVFGNPCTPPEVKIDRPQSFALQTSPSLVVRAAACLANPANGVRILVDGGLGNGGDQFDGYTAPYYEYTFPNLTASEHVVDVQIIDASHQNVAGANTHDQSVQVGIGNYLVATGDSITFGFGGVLNTSADGRNTGTGFEPLLNDLLTSNSGIPYTVEDEGVGGEISAYGASEIGTILAKYPDAQRILVQWGTNDAGAFHAVPSGLHLHPGDGGYPGSFKDHMQQIIDAVNDAGREVCLAKPPIVLGDDVTGAKYSDPTNPPQYSRGWFVMQYIMVIDELYNDPNNNIVVTPPDFWNLFNESVPGGKRYDFEYTDNFHPNGTGYQSMANRWFQKLTQ